MRPLFTNTARRRKKRLSFAQRSHFPSQVTPHIESLLARQKQQWCAHIKPSPSLALGKSKLHTGHRHPQGSRRLTEGSSVRQQQSGRAARTFRSPLWCSETSKLQAPAKTARIITFPRHKKTRLFSKNRTINYQARVEKSSLKPVYSWIRQRWCGDEKELY